jgi:hypothetical protein
MDPTRRLVVGPYRARRPRCRGRAPKGTGGVRVHQNTIVRNAITKLTAMRKERGWTTAQFGEALGVDEWEMAQFEIALRWFEDVTTEAELSSLLRYAHALDAELHVTIVPRRWWRGHIRRQRGGVAVGCLPGQNYNPTGRIPENRCPRHHCSLSARSDPAWRATSRDCRLCASDRREATALSPLWFRAVGFPGLISRSDQGRARALRPERSPSWAGRSTDVEGASAWPFRAIPTEDLGCGG